ncbi:hypothetical protein C8J57DRAFT_1704393 [Mycena rebaudengoi]|nr:hypothetical protein C8J57DRAFT_1704393 [Mycena rebaudengoi]
MIEDMMSFTVTESSVQVRPAAVIVQQAPKFPNAWLQPAEGKYVIDRVHWNTEADPEQKRRFSVEWVQFPISHLLTKTIWGIEIAGLLLRLYFGIEGCIIPVACIPEMDENIFVFTLAGPSDPTTGKKDFYLMFHESLEAVDLYLLSPGFSSVSDFHLKSSTLQPKSITPIRGGKEAMVAQYEKLGIYKSG